MEGVLAGSAVIAGVTILGDLTECKVLQNAFVVAFLASMNHVGQNTFVHAASRTALVGFPVLFFIRCLACGFLGVVFAKLVQLKGQETVVLAPHGKSLRAKLLLRAFLGNVAVLSLFVALSNIPAPFVIVVYATKGIWASVLCWAFLKESLGFREMGCMFLGFLAVALVVYSTKYSVEALDAKHNVVLGFSAAAMASFVGGLNAVVIRSMKGSVHHLSMVCALASVGLVFCIPLACVFPEQFIAALSPDGDTFRMFLAVGGCSFFMQLALNKAYRLSKAGPIMMFIESSTLLGQFFVDTTLGYRYNALAWCSCLVLGLYMALNLLVPKVKLPSKLQRKEAKAAGGNDAAEEACSDDDDQYSTDSPASSIRSECHGTDSASRDLENGSSSLCSHSSHPIYLTTFPKTVTVCGAGHVSHYLLCSLTQKPGVSVKVFAPYKNHGTKLREMWSSPGAKLQMSGALGECSADLSRVSVVDDPKPAFDSECVIFALPPPAFSEYAREVCRHARTGTVLLGLPGVGAFEWAIATACKEIGRPMSDFKVAFTQECPLSCRTSTFGQHVFVRGKKVDGIMMGCIPAGGEHAMSAWVEDMLLAQISVRPAPALQVALGTSIMIAHGFTLQACLEELDNEGRDLDEGELLWYANEHRNRLMDDADEEWRSVSGSILERCSDSIARQPNLELLSFFEMWRKWYPEVKNCETLAAVVAQNSAYQWTTVPSVTTASPGGETRRIPNTADRKFRGDVPFGLCLVKMLASRVGVQTPVFDACIQYLQVKMGKDYLRFDPQVTTRVEVGEDLKKECHFVPLLSGDACLDAYLELYCSP